MAWGKRSTSALLVAAGISTIGMFAGAASGSSSSVFPIPGLSAPHLSVAGDLRLSDGGALIASNASGSGPARTRITVTRLQLDGSVDLAYGTRGIASIPAPAGVRATALAVDPLSGNAWIGAVTPAGTSEIIALGGRGTPSAGFAAHGIAHLPAAFSGGPTALAWRDGTLLVAAGHSPCAGCRMAVLNAHTGAIIRRGSVVTSTGRSAGTPGCVPQRVTAGVLEAHGVLLATSDTARTRVCPASIVIVHPDRRSLVTARVTPIAGARSATLQGIGGTLCLAATRAQRTRIGPYYPGGPVVTPFPAPAGRLVGFTALGGGACAALLAPARGTAHVIQTAGHGRHVSVATVPRGIRPLAISRCHHHLLALGSVPSRSGRSAVIALVPVAEGPHVAGVRARTSVVTRSGMSRCAQ